MSNCHIRPVLIAAATLSCHAHSFDPWAMSTFPGATMLYESSGPPDCEGLPFHDCFKPIPPAVRSLYSPSRFAALAVNVRDASEMRSWVDGFLDVRCEGRWHDCFARLL